MKTHRALLTAALSLLLAAPVAQAQLKVGTVDMNKIFSAFYKTNDANLKLADARKAYETERQERADNHDKQARAAQQLKTEAENPALSAEKKAEKMKQLEEKAKEVLALRQEFQDFVQNREGQLQRQMMRMRNGLVEEIRAAIDVKAKAEAFDIVLDKSGNNSNLVPMVLFSKDAFDFSDAIIEVVNKDKPAAAPAAEPAKK